MSRRPWPQSRPWPSANVPNTLEGRGFDCPTAIRNTRRVDTGPARRPRRLVEAWDGSGPRVSDPWGWVVWSVMFVVGWLIAYPLLAYGLPALISAAVHVGDLLGVTARS